MIPEKLSVHTKPERNTILLLVETFSQLDKKYTFFFLEMLRKYISRLEHFQFSIFEGLQIPFQGLT